MNNKIKGLIASSLTALMLVAIVTTKTYAISDNGNTGGGSTGAYGDSAFTWVESQQGYRITIADGNMNQVSNSVDFLYNDITGFAFNGGKSRYTNWKYGSLSSGVPKYILFSKLLSEKAIGNAPQPAVSEGSNNNFSGTGEAFKKWFLNGKGGFDMSKLTLTTGVTVVSGTTTSKSPSGTPYYTGGVSRPTYTDVVRNVYDTPYYSTQSLMSSYSVRGSASSSANSALATQGYSNSASSYGISIASTIVSRYLYASKRATAGDSLAASTINYYNGIIDGASPTNAYGTKAKE